MVLGQHEPAQFRPEMALNAIWERRHDGAAIGRYPTLPPKSHYPRPEDQILNDEILVAFEAGA
jgi:hypothetical protein